MPRGRPKKLRRIWIVWVEDLAQWELREGGKRGTYLGSLGYWLDEAITVARKWCRVNATPERPIRLQKFNKNGKIAKWEASYHADSKRRKG